MLQSESYATVYVNRPAELVSQFRILLEENFQAMLRGEIKDVYGISQFADLLHVHPHHLSNTLHQETGKSPCDWINDYFINEARKLLLTTTLSVAEISYKLTFHEPTNFTKYFKKHTGFSPKQFRQQYAGKSS